MTKLKSPKLMLGVAGRLAGLSLATLTLLWGPGEARAACTNGDLLDCNPAGQTLNPAARFVDPTPPPGFLQCAGFINTAANDVSDFWENNCIPFKEGELWLRIYDQNNTIVAGARLINVDANCPWAGPTSRGYDTTNQEGEGFLPQPGACNDNSGVSFAWFEGAGSYCGCGLQSCNDIYTANAANTKVLYVGANAGDTNEITFSPPGPKGTCSFQNSVTDLKIGIYAPGQVIDTDGDGIPDADDNCPDVPNPNQEDADMDGIGDLCDECPDDIDNDSDGDGICGDVDNCPDIANPGQEDDDGDGIGDACDACPNDPKNDGDGDGVCGAIDNCPDVPNPDQEDSNRNGIGDACEVIDPPDTDSDSTGDDTTTGDGTTGDGTTGGDTTGDDTTGGDTTGGDTTGGDTTGGDTTGGNTTGGNTTGDDPTTLPDPTTGVSESGPVPTSGPGNTEPDTLPTADPGTDGSDSSSDGDSDTAGVDDGGCGCTTDDHAPLTSLLLLGLAGLGLRRRRPA